MHVIPAHAGIHAEVALPPAFEVTGKRWSSQNFSSRKRRMNHPEYTRDFHGRTVMIAGAAGNLGKAVARAFARRGARLVLVDRATQRLHEQFGETGPCLLVPTDLLDGEAVAAAVREALRQAGRIDALCNLAGGFSMGHPVHETSDAELDAMFSVNVRTMLNAVRAVVPSMLEAGAGRIVNVGAMSALRGSALMGSYCISKDAVIRLTETMAAELGSRGINVNCVLPGIIDTPENRAAMPDADRAGWVGADALADVVVFLASERARAIHGAAIPVTGRC
jgi:NAD(P)-dependent dehydrogenase (short-subunit alcohol dehydrogenase family)